MSIKKHIATTFITASTFLMISPSFVSAQQMFGGMQFSGVGAAVIGCFGNSALIEERVAILKQTIKALADSSYLGFKVGTVQQSQDEVLTLHVKKNVRKEQCKDPIAYALGNSVMNSFVDDTIRWATTGFEGTPYFVRDQESFFDNLVRDAQQTFLNGLPTANDVYGNAVRYAMIAQQTGRQASESALRGNNAPAVQAVEDFTNDFKNGGWWQFFNMTQVTSQNPLGAYLSATERQARERNKLTELKEQELAQGSGYLSQRKCVEWDYIGGASDGITGDFNASDLTRLTGGANAESERKCVKYEVVTPGKTIADQVAKATQAANERALQADELSEVFGRFLDRMLSNLANKGLAALTRPRTQIPQTGPNASVEQKQTITDIRNSFDESEFTITNPKHLQALIKAQKDYLSAIKDSRISAEESLAQLGELDYCIPGPNPQAVGLANQNIGAIIGGLQDGYIRRRFLSDKDYRQLQPVPFIVENPIAEGQFILNDPIYINEYVDGDEGKDDEKSIFVGNVQQKSTHYFTLFNTLFNREKIIAFFENAQTSQQERDNVRGAIQSALVETRKLSDYSKNMRNALSTYDQVGEITAENITELEAIHRQILGIVKTARARHIAEQRALGATVNLECLDIQYSVTDPIIIGRIRRTVDTPSSKVQTLRDAEKAFFAPSGIYRNHNLPFWNDL